MSILGSFAVPHPPLIIPAVGRGKEKEIASTVAAYRETMKEAAELKPQTVVVLSPHSIMYADYFHISPGRGGAGNFAQFGAPQVEISVTYDTEFVRTLADVCKSRQIAAGTLGEKQAALAHATLIPLWFLNEFTADFDVVRIGLSGLSAAEHYRLGEAIRFTAEKLGRRVVIIASGDLSHKLKADGPYGFAEEGPIFDKICMECLATGDFLRLLSIEPRIADNAAECGLRSFWIMAGAFDGQGVTARQLSYEGPFGVGYGVAAFAPADEDENRHFAAKLLAARREKLDEIKKNEDAFVKLARLSVETIVNTRRRAACPDNLPDELTGRRAGAFVSLKKDGRLRGCIGTFMPTQNTLAEEILQNAVSAATGDPRFAPVTSDELCDLVYSVDVLTEPQKIASEEALNPKKYGVIVKSGSRRGLLLPDLEGVDTVKEQIAIARQKGGIKPTDPVELFRFEVVRHR